MAHLERENTWYQEG